MLDNMSLLCKLVMPTCCSGLDWDFQASEAAWVELNGRAKVEVGVEAVRQVVDYVGTSTLVMGFSTEVVEEHTTRMVGSQVGSDMEGCKVK